MQTKAQEWIDRAKEGKSRRQDVWFLLEHTLAKGRLWNQQPLRPVEGARRMPT